MEILLIALFVLLGLNFYAVYHCICSEEFDRVQKMGQILIIFILPLLGSLIVIYLAKDESLEIYRPKPNANRDDNEGNAFHIGHGRSDNFIDD